MEMFEKEFLRIRGLAKDVITLQSNEDQLINQTRSVIPLESWDRLNKAGALRTGSKCGDTLKTTRKSYK